MLALISITTLAVFSFTSKAQAQLQCNGRCVLYSECPELLELIRNPDRTAQDNDTLKEAYCGNDAEMPKLCCKETPIVPDDSCVNPDGEPGTCVGLYDCPEIVDILQQKPVPLEDISFVNNSRCGGPDAFSVCCSQEQRSLTQEEPYVSRSSAASSPNSSDCCCRDAPRDMELQCNSRCVLYNECPELLELIRNPHRTAQDNDTLKEAYCGNDGEMPKLCCKETPIVPDNSCVNPDGEPGKCVGLYDCPAIVEILQQKPVPLEDISFVKNSRCLSPYICSVCCSEGSMTPVEPSVCKPSASPPPRSSDCCGRGSYQDRIFGGDATSVDQYPWLTLIEYRSLFSDNINLYCGGALISGKYVLTAGHCVTGKILDVAKPIKVRLGEYDTWNEGKDCTESNGGGQECTEGLVTIPIEKITLHPNYDTESNVTGNDIALIRMTHLAPYTDFIRPICLPSTDFRTIPPPDSEQYIFFVAGWGLTENNFASNIKLHVDVPYKTLAQCVSSYEAVNRPVALWKGHICAGGEEGKDACKGDSGGPLMYENDRVFEVVGIVSFGLSPCGFPNVPGVYTNVYEYMMWIQSVIQD